MDAISTEHVYVVKRIGVDLHIATGFAKVNTRPMAMTTTKMRFCAGRGGKNVILGESKEREKKSLRSVQRKSRELTSFLETFCHTLP